MKRKLLLIYVTLIRYLWHIERERNINILFSRVHKVTNYLLYLRDSNVNGHLLSI